MADAKFRQERDKELAALREKKLTTLLNRHFSEAAAAITAERKAAEVALREIERRRAEVALSYALSANKKDRGAEVGQTLTRLDEMYLELKRREENVRKRERDTLEKYHRYIQKGDVVAMAEGRMNFNGEQQQNNSIYRSANTHEKNVQSMVPKGNVNKIVQKFSTHTTPLSPSDYGINVRLAAQKFNNSGPSVAFTDTHEVIDAKKTSIPSVTDTNTETFSVSSSDQTPYTLQESMMTEEALFLNAKEAARQAEEEGKLEQSKFQAQLAENNASLMAKAINAWGGEGDDSDGLTVTSYGNSSFGESITTYNSTSSSLYFISEAELRLTNFLKANTEAIASISNTAQEELDTKSIYSAGEKQEFDDAVRAAEEAAREMADAVARTSASSASVASTNSSRKKKSEKWYQYWSEEHAREYYFQPSSGKAVWDPPTEFEDSGTKVKKSDLEGENVSEEEKLIYNVQNWSMDDFLPDKKRKKSRSRRSRKYEGRDNMSRGSKSSKSSKGRKNKQLNVSLPRALLASPNKSYSLWNSQNRKLRKKVVRRSFWGLVLTGVAYKTGTGVYSFYKSNEDGSVAQQIPLEKKMQGHDIVVDEHTSTKNIVKDTKLDRIPITIEHMHNDEEASGLQVDIEEIEMSNKAEETLIDFEETHDKVNDISHEPEKTIIQIDATSDTDYETSAQIATEIDKIPNVDDNTSDPDEVGVDIVEVSDEVNTIIEMIEEISHEGEQVVNLHEYVDDNEDALNKILANANDLDEIRNNFDDIEEAPVPLDFSKKADEVAIGASELNMSLNEVKNFSNETEEIIEEVDNISDETEEIMDEIENISDEAEDIMDDIESISDEAEDIMDEVESISDETEEINEIENTSDVTEDIMDEIENISDVTEEIIDELENISDETVQTIDEIDDSVEVDKASDGAGGISNEVEEILGDIEETLEKEDETYVELNEMTEEMKNAAVDTEENFSEIDENLDNIQNTFDDTVESNGEIEMTVDDTDENSSDMEVIVDSESDDIECEETVISETSSGIGDEDASLDDENNNSNLDNLPDAEFGGSNLYEVNEFENGEESESFEIEEQTQTQNEAQELVEEDMFEGENDIELERDVESNGPTEEVQNLHEVIIDVEQTESEKVLSESDESNTEDNDDLQELEIEPTAENSKEILSATGLELEILPQNTIVQKVNKPKICNVALVKSVVPGCKKYERKLDTNTEAKRCNIPLLKHLMPGCKQARKSEHVVEDSSPSIDSNVDSIDSLVPLNEKRPGHCNIPMMYLLAPVCKKQAKENPLFDLQEFTNMML